MGIGSVDLFAVVLATVASMVVGTIWYVALGHFWRRAARLGSEMSEPHFGIFVMTLVCEFVMAVVFAVWVGVRVCAGELVVGVPARVGCCYAVVIAVCHVLSLGDFAFQSTRIDDVGVRNAPSGRWLQRLL